jgi:hypothetical protein
MESSSCNAGDEVYREYNGQRLYPVYGAGDKYYGMGDGRYYIPNPAYVFPGNGAPEFIPEPPVPNALLILR